MDAVAFSEIIRNYALVAAALAGLGIAVWRAGAADRQSRAQRDQVAQTRREHVAEIFAAAVGNLDNEKLHVRLGAILMLREHVEAFPELSRPTVDLLTSYLADVDYQHDEPPADIRAIVDLILPPTGKDK